MSFWGISSKNEEQKSAMQTMLNDKPFLFLTGPAGTGKTLIAQAVGLHRVVEKKDYNKLIYTRLQEQMGKDLGALTGDVNEKTYPFLRAFMDNFELMSNKDALEYLVMGDSKKRKVFFDPIQTMRGGSMHQSWIMIDEAQNLDPATIAAIGTRLAKGSKMIFLGNFAQVDNMRLRKPANNGLYKLLNGLYEKEAHKYFDHINLTQVERHPAITIIEEILRDHEMDPVFEELEKRGTI